ncbi:Pimeloyl-ACP methyl ester carboxylesterase [Variovorax sp. CF079]|uniref:alpha/beta fold hydrolase n=1 Tax=Variovorax sp. CF079 TaxID=1882774 RepID=UPI00088ED994|nr:alpha/beta hydrolase [Variovorax sp. CF079]SDE93875.1 Pimeloyl-ACP methyl ester carboxylesterase [Variovorax sp. CF079]
MQLPPEVHTWEDAKAIESCALRRETPCGEGVVVWRIWGAEHANPVVLLHGGSGSWNHWVRNIRELVESGHRVLAPDLPGFGESSVTPVGFDADAQAEWIALGLETLLGRAPCDLVCFSFGSMVGALLASQHTSRVRRLILVGAPALTVARGPTLQLRAWKSLEPGSSRLEAHRHNLRAIMLSYEPTIDDLAVALHAANVERDRIPQRRLFKTDCIRKLLPSIAIPIWGIWGGADALHKGQLDANVQGLAAAPNVQTFTLIPRSGHWVQFEAASTFNALLGSILRDPPGFCKRQGDS